MALDLLLSPLPKDWAQLNVNTLTSSGDIDIGGNFNVIGNGNIAGNLNVTGTINSGNSPITGSLIPNSDNVYDLGSGSERWRSLYLGTDANVGGGLNVFGNTDLGGQLIVSSPAYLNNTAQVGTDLSIGGNITNVGGINSLGGTWYTSGVIGAGVQINSPIFVAQANTNQIVFSLSGTPLVINANPIAVTQTYNFNDIGGNGTIFVSSGNTGSQSSSTTDPVTVNGSSGKITCFTSTAAAQASVSFTVTNSYILTTNVILASVSSYSGTTGIPYCYVSSVSAGSFVINVVNSASIAALNGVITISFLIA